MAINRVNISGNLTRDAELRVTASGTQVLGFGVAQAGGMEVVMDNARSLAGYLSLVNIHDPATGGSAPYSLLTICSLLAWGLGYFVDCTMFGNRAEAIARYLTKGSKVAVEGKLRYSSWERDGQRRSKLEVVVDEIEFLSRSASPAAGDGPMTLHEDGTATPTPPVMDVYDEDIPF